MARPPRHRIELSEDERAALERVARAEKLAFQDVQRARIVLYAAEGVPDTEIAARLDTSSGLVGRWRRRFAERRLEGLKDKPRSGRPRRFPPERVAEVKAIACELPATHGVPLGRFSRTELHRLVIERGVCEASGVDDLALVARRRDQALADQVVDLPARPRLCLEGRPRLGSL